MKEENIFNLLKIHNELLDVYHNSLDKVEKNKEMVTSLDEFLNDEELKK